MTHHRSFSNEESIKSKRCSDKIHEAGGLFEAPSHPRIPAPSGLIETAVQIFERLQILSEWLNVPMPELSIEEGDFLLDDSFIAWHARHGVSLDLTCCGDLRLVVLDAQKVRKADYVSNTI